MNPFSVNKNLYNHVFSVFRNPDSGKIFSLRKRYYVLSCKPGVIDTVQMRGDHNCLRSRLAYLFDIRQVHDQPAERCSCFTAIQNNDLWLILSDRLFYFQAVNRIGGNI